MPKFQPASIKELLRVGEVDDEELAAVLTSISPRGAQLSTNDVEYRTAEDEWMFSLRYSEGVVVDAVTGPAFTASIGEQIQQALAEAFDVTTTKRIWRVPMFGLRYCEGWYRDKDDFVIRPAPEEAPRPEIVIAQHPWVLEFSFIDSPNFMVRNLRIERRRYELALVLNLLLKGWIDGPSNRGRRHWVYTRSTDGTPGPGGCEWLQEGYFIPGFDMLTDDFSDVSVWNPLTEVSNDTYYGRNFRSDFMSVPAAMTDLSNAFSGLSGSRRGRFLRSCYWLHMADVVWNYSQSLHLVSLINGAECLAQSSEKRLQTDSSTKMFLAFMKDYAPGGPSGSRLNKIYDVRSQVTHGGRLLGYDTPHAFGLRPTSTADRESGDEALLLARGAIINWLIREAGNPENLLSIDPYPKRSTAKPGAKSKVRIITP